MSDPTPESQQIIGSFAPHWALTEEGLGIDWSVEEVRKQAWELINALADQLDFYRRILLGSTVVIDEMVDRAMEYARERWDWNVSPGEQGAVREDLRELLRAALGGEQ